VADGSVDVFMELLENWTSTGIEHNPSRQSTLDWKNFQIRLNISKTVAPRAFWLR
jgi:hypothetical protein